MAVRKGIQPEVFPFYDYRRQSLSLAVQKGDYLFVSGHTASEYDSETKKMVCKGNMAEQARVSYQKIKLLLETAGGTLDDVIKLTEYIAPIGIGDYPVVDEVKRQYFGNNLPVISPIGVHNLLRPGAFMEVEAVAVLGKDKHRLDAEPLNSERLAAPKAVRTGDLLFIAGQCGKDDKTGRIIGEGDVVAQAEQTYRNIKATLEKAGATFADVVKIIDYITPAGLTKYEKSRKIRAEYFDDGYPAVTELVVEKLLTEDALIEVDCIAVLGGKKEIYDFDRNLFPQTLCSPMVKKGNLIFFSSLVGFNTETRRLIAGDVVAQMNQLYKNAGKMLIAADISWKDVLKTVDYIAPEGGMNYRNTANVRRQYFGDNLPASTGIFMNRLKADSLVQVDFVAVL